MKSADLRLLEQQLLVEPDNRERFDRCLAEVLARYPDAVEEDYDGIPHYVTPYAALVPPSGKWVSLAEQCVTLLNMVGVTHPDVTRHLGAPRSDMTDIADEPDLQFAACRRIIERTSIFAQYSPLPLSEREQSRLRELLIDRMHALLMEFPMLAHPRLLQDIWTRPANKNDPLPEVAPLLHDFMAHCDWPLPVMSDRFQESSRRAWARHPAITAGLTATKPQFFMRKHSPPNKPGAVTQPINIATLPNTPQNAGRLPSAAPPTTQDQAPRAASILRLERFRVEGLTVDGRAQPGMAPLLWDISNGDWGMFRSRLLVVFDKLWINDDVVVDAQGRLVDSIIKHAANPPAIAALIAELAEPSAHAVRNFVAENLAAELDRVFIGSSQPGNRVHHLICALAAGGAIPHEDAARRVMDAIFDRTGDTDGAQAMVMATTAEIALDESSGAKAQAFLRAFLHHGVAIETLRAKLDAVPPVLQHSYEPLSRACDSLLAAKSMTDVIGAARQADQADDVRARAVRRAAI